jgi:hypothetical protein
LDKFASLNHAFPLKSNNSFLFLDQQIKDNNDYNAINNSRYSFLNPNENDFILSFVNDRYVIAPFDVTNHYEPAKVWSKTATNDPGNAYFSPQLESLGIENWDFDYGKGLVMTKAIGANISIPVNIEDQNNVGSNDGMFYLFMRYLKNEKAGALKVYMDGKLISQVKTSDEISNNFVWEKIATVNLKKGRHTLVLENIDGFNAVNIFSLITPHEMSRLRTQADQLLERTSVIYVLEPGSTFYNNKGTDSGLLHYLFDHYNGTFTKTIKSQFKVPKNTDLVSLQFLAKQNPDRESSYSVQNLEVTPAHKKYDAFTSDFQTKKPSVTPAPTPLRQFDWMNHDKDTLSISETNGSYGNKSLKVDIKQGNFSHWGIVSTDFIPIIEDRSYNLSLDVLAQDVKQLHSKVYFYDSNKTEIKLKEEFVSDGKDGTFEQRYGKSLSAPLGTKYIKLQIWVSPNSKVHSSYLLDNVKLQEIIPYDITYKDNFASFQDLNPQVQELNIYNNRTNNDTGKALLVKLDKGNSTQSYKIQTRPFQVREDRTYNFTVTLAAKSVNNLSGVVSFKSSGDVSEDNSYGNNASNGQVMHLSPDSEIHNRLDIIKPSNYTLALRAKTCGTCTFLRVNMIENNYDKNNIDDSNATQTSIIPLRNNSSGLKWLYSNSTYALKKGIYDLEIYSDSQTDLDSVILYQVDNGNGSKKGNFSGNVDSRKQYKTLIDIFDTENSLPAKIVDYKKISPAKHIVDIENATSPYIISFAETYDPLWVAYTDTGNGNNNHDKNNNFKTSSIPLYSVINGFYVNKTGNYSLVIEFQPQKWFIEAGTVSLLTLISILTIYFISTQRTYLVKLKNRVQNLLRAIAKHLE